MGKGRVLLKNTIMLYLLTFSTYILNLVIVPYQTRVLGPEKYGLIGLATAIIAYVQLFIDFGFLLSATEEVANNQGDKRKLSKIFTSVTLNKFLLSLASISILFAACWLIPRWKENLLFIMLYCVSAIFSSLMPDFLYRGIEKMGSITVRTVLIRVFFTAMVLVLVKEPADYLLIPLLQIIGNGIALIATYFHLYFKLGVKFVGCRLAEIFGTMKKSLVFFASRIAGTVYSAANTIILDFISGGAMTAFYTSADKLISTAKSGLSPVSDSMYPYMIKHKDFKMVKKVLLLLEPVIIIGCTVLFIWAVPICTWFFGDEYTYTAYALRAMLPIAVMILPSYIFGFPVLGAMGLSKHANYSVIVASVIHVFDLVLLGVLSSMGIVKFDIVTLGIATSIAEFVTLTYRLIVVIKNRRLLTQKGAI